MVRADLSEMVWYSCVERSESCGSGRVGRRRGSLTLKGSPSSMGSVGCGGVGGGGGARGVMGGVKARFFNGGSPRFLVDSLLFSMMSNTSRLSSRILKSRMSVEIVNTSNVQSESLAHV